MRLHLPKLVLSVLAGLVGCGSPGAPLPPSLNLPRPVSDLHAIRKAGKVMLSWTSPSESTDHQRLRQIGRTKICRDLRALVGDCQHYVGDILAGTSDLREKEKKRPSLNAKVQGIFEDTISESLQRENPTSQIVYALSVLNDSGRSAGLSNQVTVPSAPTLSAPGGLRAEVQVEGILLTWEKSQGKAISGLSFKYRVYRRADGTLTDTVVGELPLVDSGAPHLLDRNLEWEKKYLYRITVVTAVNDGTSNAEVEGDDTNSLPVLAHDTFPPAVPSGLEAVFTNAAPQSFVDLIWTPDTDADLAGYNVYRLREGEAVRRLNSKLVRVPAYRDFAISAGDRYSYFVSAVDVRGNESARSEPASESVP